MTRWVQTRTGSRNQRSIVTTLKPLLWFLDTSSTELRASTWMKGTNSVRCTKLPEIKSGGGSILNTHCNSMCRARWNHFGSNWKFSAIKQHFLGSEGSSEKKTFWKMCGLKRSTLFGLYRYGCKIPGLRDKHQLVKPPLNYSVLQASPTIPIPYFGKIPRAAGHPCFFLTSQH